MDSSNIQNPYNKLLDSLIFYGNSRLESASLKYRVHWKKKVLFLLMGAIQSYTESINRLIQPPNIYDKPAESLLRSLMETMINLDYIYCCSTQENAIIFLNKSIKDKIDFAKKYKKFTEDHPSWNIKFGKIQNSSDWDLFIGEQEKDLLKIEKHFKKQFKNLPDLRGRAISIDNFLSAKNKLNKKNSIEFYYLNFYQYFSQVTHLTSPGLERFFNIDDTGKTRINIDGKPDSVEYLSTVTSAIYLSALNFFLTQFKLKDKNDKDKIVEFRKTIKSLSKSK